MKTTTKSKSEEGKVRVNIIFRKDLWNIINKRVEAGKRSDYINELVREDLDSKSRREAWDYIKDIRKNDPLDMTTEEVILLKNYGRK